MSCRPPSTSRGGAALRLADTVHCMKTQTGHEYTKSNVKFAKSVQQSDAITKLEAFADANRDTQGVFTIGDEKVRFPLVRMAETGGLAAD